MKLPSATTGLALAAFLASNTAVNAAILFSGTAIAFPPSTAVLGAPLATMSDTVTDDELNFKATVKSDVYGPVGGPLTFAYTISNIPSASTSPNSELVAFALRLNSSFLPAAFDVNSVAGPGAAPIAAIYVGNTLAFTWGVPSISEGGSSIVLVVTTTAPSYTVGVGGVIDGTSEDAMVFVAVPEPSTYAGLFALGLAGFAAYRRVRK